MQTLDISEPPVLDVENHGFRPIACYLVPQFFVRMGYVHRKMRAQPACKGSGQTRILFKNHNMMSHMTPDLYVVNGWR